MPLPDELVAAIAGAAIGGVLGPAVKEAFAKRRARIEACDVFIYSVTISAKKARAFLELVEEVEDSLPGSSSIAPPMDTFVLVLASNPLLAGLLPLGIVSRISDFESHAEWLSYLSKEYDSAWETQNPSAKQAIVQAAALRTCRLMVDLQGDLLGRLERYKSAVKSLDPFADEVENA